MYVLFSIHRVRALNRPNVLEACSPMSSYDNFRDGAAQYQDKWRNSVLLLASSANWASEWSTKSDVPKSHKSFGELAPTGFNPVHPNGRSLGRDYRLLLYD